MRTRYTRSAITTSPSPTSRRNTPGRPFQRIWSPDRHVAYDEFRQSYTHAREVRADIAFGEQILDIADDGTNDWIEAKNGGAPRLNKEVVLRSKIRIEVRQFQMACLHPETWGERQQIDIKDDWSLLTDQERRRKAEEIIAMIRELREPPPQPPRLVYRTEEAPDDEPPVTRGIGSRLARSR